MTPDPEWKPLWGFVDPPPAPPGYSIEVERDCFLGFVISYRYVPDLDTQARMAIEGYR
jgi:hypothetical protein